MAKPPKEIQGTVDSEVLKAGKFCYSQGVIGTVIETATTNEKNTDGSYKNPWTEEGREKIRDTCFNEFVAPTIIKAGGNDQEIQAVRTKAKEERSR